MSVISMRRLRNIRDTEAATWCKAVRGLGWVCKTAGEERNEARKANFIDLTLFKTAALTRGWKEWKHQQGGNTENIKTKD